ncbi:MAG: enolase C-terminal domain-like protein [Rhodothermales bacterium]
MNRRAFLGTAALGACVGLVSGLPERAAATADAKPGAHTASLGAIPGRSDLRITRIRVYEPSNLNRTFNQSNRVVTVETDGGITGVGEGGTPDMIEQMAAQIVGQDPFQIEHLWQLMYRGWFYPPGLEKLHGLGALDMALWDIKGRALDVPVYEMLGGLTRDHIECYSTGYPWQGDLESTARACVEAGFYAYRISADNPRGDDTFDPNDIFEHNRARCEAVHRGVGSAGHWCIDFHTRLDLTQAVRLSALIEAYEPFFVEDLVRSENKEVYQTVRQKVNVPIAVGEHYGDRWTVNELVEDRLIDYSRVTLPNAGGITEFKKLAALCETHYVGLVPHFTGTISTAALVHACGSSPNPVVIEMRGSGPSPEAHLPETFEFIDGKIRPNDRPGLGVTFDPAEAELVAEITDHDDPIPQFRRPDGSIQNW